MAPFRSFLTVTAAFVSGDAPYAMRFAERRGFKLHESQEGKPEYGVSYIGGDPCGSKYNDDPFDVKPSKPGFPDDMKARIEALAEKKRLENEEKKEDDD